MVMDLLEEPQNLMDFWVGFQIRESHSRNKSLKLQEDLGGGNSNIFFYVHPENWGKGFHFDFVIFFKGVGEKPPNRDCFC